MSKSSRRRQREQREREERNLRRREELSAARLSSEQVIEKAPEIRPDDDPAEKREKEVADFLEKLFRFLIALLAILVAIFKGFDKPIHAIGCGFLAVACVTAWLAWHAKRKWRRPKLIWSLFAAVILATGAASTWWGYTVNSPPRLLPKEQARGKSNPTLIIGLMRFELLDEHPATIVRFEGREMLKLEHAKGATYVSCEVRGPNGDMIAVVERNPIISNRDNILEMELKRGSLMIRSKQNEILNVEHPDSRTIIMSGALRMPDGSEVLMNEKGLKLVGGVALQGIGFGFKMGREKATFLMIGGDTNTTPSLIHVPIEWHRQQQKEYKASQ